MRLLLLLLAVLGALILGGLWLLPVLLDRAPGVLVLLALAVLVIVNWPRRRCRGYEIHCSGCDHH